MTWRLFDDLYYIVHRCNLGSILARGILSYNEVVRQGIGRVDISDPGAQRWRSRCEPVFGHSIHDYVPLYLVILAVSTDALRGAVRLFSDGNAASRCTRFSTDSSILRTALDVLQADRWCAFEDGGRRRCAEALVFRQVPTTHIRKVLCHSAAGAKAVQREHDFPAAVDQDFFFRA